MNLLDLKNLSVLFGSEDRPFTAVDKMELTVAEGEVVGIVGESGSGKSVTSLAIMGLIDFPETRGWRGFPRDALCGQQPLRGRGLRGQPHVRHGLSVRSPRERCAARPADGRHTGFPARREERRGRLAGRAAGLRRRFCGGYAPAVAPQAPCAARRGAPEEDGQTIVFCKIDKLCHSNNRFRKVSWRP